MKPIVRIPVAMLVTSAVISLGWIGVHASEECVHFIQKRVRHHHSAATLAAWAAWDKAHPNWHPKPRNPVETMAAVDFACSVPIIQKPVDGQLPLLQTNLFDLPLEMLPPEPLPMVALNTPPVLNDITGLPMVSPPIYSPQYPNLFGSVPPHQAPPGITPEPSTWMLLATAMLSIVSLGWRRPRPANRVG